MRFLRQNTAVLISVGPFLDKTDGVTLETALTITNERITLTADTDDNSAPTNILDNVTGATSGTSNDLNYITGNDAGMMQLELAAADTNRVGRMFLTITDAANHVPVFHEFFVLPQAIYDWLTGVIVPLPSNMTQILGTAVSTPATAGILDVNVKNIDNDAASASGTVTFPNATLASTTNITAGTITTVTNLTNAPTNGDLTATMKTSVTTAATAATPTAAAVTGAVGSVTGNVGGNVVGSVASVVGAVGSVTGLTASNLDVAVSTLATAANLATVAGYLDTEIAAIQAKTDNLPASPAAVGSAMTLDSTLDLYHSDIEFNDDGANNEYTAVWFKNGVRVTSGITSPTIQVVSRSDGTDFIASTAMTQIGTTGAYKFNTSTVVTAGETYLVLVGATIDGGSRSFAKLISRDA